uniref:Protein phosphatase 1, regulatory (inhibitor) subunit 1C n=1 Tax=Astyanax mexicanus TaxID=7994 RepID=A0A8B9LND8_ASTMX
MEPNSPKKIQFAVPLFQSHLDPQAAEHVNDKQSSSSSQEENQSAQLSPAQRKTSVYTPPTMRELQLVVEQHFQRQELEAGHSDSPDTPSPITAQHYGNAAQWANHNCPEPNGNEGYVSSDAQAGSSEAGGKSRPEPGRF